MTQSFLDMMYLFSCGARGVMPTLDHKIDFKEIYKHAHSQGVWPTTFLALKKLYDNNELNIDKALFKKLQDEIMYQSIQQIKRLDFIHKMIKELEDNGIECCVLKGEVLAQLYHEPLLRPSSDTDILIDKTKVKKATKILKKMGFEVEPKHKNDYHIACNHPIAGKTEVHFQLYRDEWENIWFDKKTLNQESYTTIYSTDSNLKTLGITDGLVFTCLHFIKHFLQKGAGIRQMMDLLLYVSNYKKDIDWGRFNALIKYLKYDKFIDSMIGIGIKYCNLDLNNFKHCLTNYLPKEKIMLEILDDIYVGGIFGQDDKIREGFSFIYTKERINSFKQGRYEGYINELGKVNYAKAFFPNRATLRIGYSYVSKSAFLIPIAWVHRYYNFVIVLFSKQRRLSDFKLDKTPNNDVIKKRLNLIHDLDMI